MIRCNLSRYMGEQKMNISDVARQTSLNRSTISLLYHEKATRVDLEALEKLCKIFDCSVGEMLEISAEVKS
ncbi:helix-turn-helix domain-containing protein [Microbulbifer sp. ZKSA004]|uniref:helix-turn-helix domain-containing protein n=1 Tax=Microbulbifer sp. ZKSA004 TaxID=3243389 RepID=UPI00403A3275